MSKWFDNLITFFIILNSVLLASKEYRKNYDPNYDSNWNAYLEDFDIAFTVIFLLECVINIVALGFTGHRNSYLSDYWNWMDFVIVLISVASLTPWANQDSLKAFRTARVLRPLRSIKSLKSMR